MCWFTPHFLCLLIWAAALAFALGYSLLFQRGNLPLPLLVLGQYCVLAFLFQTQRREVRERVLLYIILSTSTLVTLFLLGIPWIQLCLLAFTYTVLPNLFRLEKGDFPLYCLVISYNLHSGLASWGFSLATELLLYSIVAQIVKRKDEPQHNLLGFISLILFFSILGNFDFEQHELFIEPKRLISLFSGSCLLYLVFSKRTPWQYCLAFSSYFLSSLLLAILVSPDDCTQVWGIPSGVLIFLISHLYFILFLSFLKLTFSREALDKVAPSLVPISLTLLFRLLSHFPEVAFLGTWMEGFDLLMLLFSITSILKSRGKERSST